MSTTATPTNTTGTWEIDPSHSQVGFTARHAMVTKVRGSFNDFEGTVVVNDDDLASTQITVIIQAKSIDTRNEQRDGHLRSNDFLAMDEFPEITFVSTSVTPTDASGLDVTGDLTIKGITNTVRIPFSFEGTATDPFGNARAGFEGAVTINRKDYGVTWNAALETGGVLVSEKITLEFDISAIKQA
ncbi:YceI family protein [Tessaracoccus antarcticus]|uniref:Polyisoprenoid-binding protein n=1 Tax=Tessaracoccus antarcticus TaxID=2479848 RepID=A0A3M0G4Q1_9ACTN|nr:YceI family protein [Tessaracoccus antarcticus]RMB59991.1 polyisoprenoid-binding protein [Tessaracoccus antarcticus]